VRSDLVDWAKGFAILSVLLIHARPLAGWWIHDHVIDRAVPVFIVLFGTTSELWWTRRRAVADRATTIRDWYRTRLWGLMVPVWAALTVLWALRFATGFGASAPYRVVLTYLGYMPWVGTGWFVTLALEMVVLFPVLRLLLDRIGVVAMLVLTAAILVASHLHQDAVITLVRTLVRDRSMHADPYMTGYYFFWIFAPAKFFSVICGVLIARHCLSPSPVAGLLAAALVVAGGLVAGRLMHPPSQVLMAFLDVPLTLAVMSAGRVLRVLPRIGSTVAWYGRHSWGVYLGQLVVHETIHDWATAHCNGPVCGWYPEQASSVVRWGYFFVLLASGTLGVVAGNRLLERVSD
jgi:hypothetical protein